MGEYWHPVNFTKREYIHQRRVGDGLKMGEWNYSSKSNTLKCIAALFESGRWSKEDDIRAVSDYGNEVHMYGETTDVDADPDGLFCLARENFADVSEAAAELAHVTYEPQ